ncbi:AraC family transcriptional regulator [Marinobacter sp. KMM 10035]|uniref:AraC family transcriptional regulator n=1 Tax=Marinobacter sp. KMM 10035 TaxID=3134034 RepID=UPI00397AF8B8
MTDSQKTLVAGLLAAFMLFMSGSLFAETDPAEDSKAVAERVQDLKKKVIRLNRDLFILEEDLLFPASTQFVVFLSVDAGKFLELDAVKLKVNGDIVASHLYTERQVTALERGGMQRLYIGNLKTGTHEVTAFVEGIGPNNRAYKQAATLSFEKGTDTAALEIRIEDRSSDYQPMVSIVEWE